MQSWVLLDQIITCDSNEEDLINGNDDIWLFMECSIDSCNSKSNVIITSKEWSLRIPFVDMAALKS